MRKVAALCAVLLVVTTLLHAQEPLRGRLVDRDGIPQRGCRLEFFFLNDKYRDKPAFEAYTDEYGVFLLHPRKEEFFIVRVWLDGRSAEIKGKVRVGNKGIDPDPLIVDW